MSVYGFRFYFTPLKGVLFAFPSRYLSAIGSCLVFSLGSWSTRIPAGFLVPRRTQVPHQRVRSISPTRLSRSPAYLPRHFRYKPVFSQLFGSSPCGPTTPHYAVWAPPLSLAATYGISGGSLLFLISFPVLLRWFVHFTQFRSTDLFYSVSWRRHLCRRVTPFGRPRITGYVLLPAAFRSLSRPSSPYSSQASTINLYSLDHIIFTAAGFPVYTAGLALYTPPAAPSLRFTSVYTFQCTRFPSLVLSKILAYSQNL